MLSELEIIRKCTGRKAKIAMLQRMPHLKPLLELAYNPFKRYRTAENAAAHLKNAGLPVDPTLVNMVLKKDLRIGAAAKTINAAWPGLIPEHDVTLDGSLRRPRFKGFCDDKA